MAATATSVTPIERPGGNTFAGTFVVDLSSLTTLTGEVVTLTVPGVLATDVATVSPQTALTAGMSVSYVRCAANTITFAVWNGSAGTVNEASATWNYAVIRSSTKALR